MTSRTASDSARIKLNLKNLRRHDETITEIVESTSYVVLYLMEKDRSWVKSNIEGPMFLFKRSVQPFYGFFVLNRQGLEYFQQDLTPECMVELMGDFIAFEPASADKIHGIWCYEPEARKSMCRKMEELRALSVMSPTLHPRLLSYNQSIPIDLLFASPIPAAQTLPTSAQRLPTALSTPNKPQYTGLKLLDTIFASANAVLPSQAQLTSSAQPPQSHRQVSINSNLPPPQLSARSLLAMIGHPNGTSPTQASAAPQLMPSNLATPPRSKPTSPIQTRTKPIFAPPLLSHDVFDKYPIPLPIKKVIPPVIPSPQKVQPIPRVTAPASPSAPVIKLSPSGGGPGKGTGGARGLGAQILKENLGIAFMDRSGSPSSERSRLGDGLTSPSGRTTPIVTKDGLNGEQRMLEVLKNGLVLNGVGIMKGEVPLDKGEFVRSVLSLVYTSKFSTDLYEDYLSRFERRN